MPINRAVSSSQATGVGVVAIVLWAALALLTVRAGVSRPGRRVQLLEGSIFAHDEVEVVRARALRIQRAQHVPPEVVPDDAVPPGPELVPVG